MKNSEAKLQIALIASNLMQRVRVHDYGTGMDLNQTFRDMDDDIKLALMVAEKLIDLANPESAGLDTTDRYYRG